MHFRAMVNSTINSNSVFIFGSRRKEYQLCPECVEVDKGHDLPSSEERDWIPNVEKEQESDGGEVNEPLTAAVLDGVKTLGHLITLFFRPLF